MYEFVPQTLDQIFTDEAKQESEWKDMLIDTDLAPMHRLGDMFEQSHSVVMDNQPQDVHTVAKDDSLELYHQAALLAVLLGSLIPELAFPALSLTHAVLIPLVNLLTHELKRKKAIREVAASESEGKAVEYDDLGNVVHNEGPVNTGGENREEIILDLLIQVLTYCPCAKMDYSRDLKAIYERLLKVVEEHFSTRDFALMRSRVLRAMCLLNFSLINNSSSEITDELRIMLVDIMYNYEDAATRLGENLGGLIVREFNEAATSDADTEEALLHLISQIHLANSGEYMYLIDSNDFGVVFDVILRRLQRTDSTDAIGLSYLQALKICLDRDAQQRRYKHLDKEILDTLKLVINTEETPAETKRVAFDVLKHDSLL
eukprot:TRINITY_DN45348_c0_g1_i1.p1 TRINITY_DN45348_c0_g1~~TRINITY_DN45348_c0_g1_i1.p1  ORF type:complete len:374 (+),score=93.52 TRINITY_DN45348_c0_g1_i1:79-1200(+)